jgi:hypothetical protein
VNSWKVLVDSTKKSCFGIFAIVELKDIVDCWNLCESD